MPPSLRPPAHAIVSSLVFLTLAAHAHATVTYLAQGRTVAAQWGTIGIGHPAVQTGSASAMAPDLGPWSGTVMSSAFGGTSATQTTAPGQTAIALSMGVTTTLAVPSTTGTWGTGSSQFYMGFEVTEPTLWEFTGSWSYNAGAYTPPTPPQDYVRLTGSTQGQMADMTFTSSSTEATFGNLHAGGGAALLLPGETYTYLASISQPNLYLTRTATANTTLTFRPAPSPTTAAALLIPAAACAFRRRRA